MRAVVVLAGLVLGACALVPPAAMIEGATTVATDKTVGDHIISLWSGKNCSTVRQARGLTYCEEDEINPRPAVFCYRTLGDVVCYDRPDPYGRGRPRVDAEAPGLPPGGVRRAP